MNLNKKIIMGGAQFGMNYGIANKNGEISFKNLNKILNYAIKRKVHIIDTATSYKSSLKKIFKISRNNNLKKKIKVIIKVKSSSILNIDKFKKLDDNYNIYCIMAHSSKLFLNRSFQKKIQKLKKNYKFKLGVSIYENRELINLKDHYKIIDILQIPFNIVNYKTFNTKIFKKLKRKKIELHARSIFYQGVLLMNEKNIKIKFKNFHRNFNELKYLSKKNKINLIFLCIKFVLNRKYFDKLIFGFDTLTQFKEIIRNLNSRKKIPHEIRNYLKNTDLKPSLPDPREF
tara:strand:+ start:2908 stop:3768 length:861 start_codon:yes stop_codon:yes gene_type:complete